MSKPLNTPQAKSCTQKVSAGYYLLPLRYCFVPKTAYEVTDLFKPPFLEFLPPAKQINLQQQPVYSLDSYSTLSASACWFAMLYQPHPFLTTFMINHKSEKCNNDNCCDIMFKMNFNSIYQLVSVVLPPFNMTSIIQSTSSNVVSATLIIDRGTMCGSIIGVRSTLN